MPEKWPYLLHFFFQKKKSVHKLTFIELVCVHSHLKKKCLQNMPEKWLSLLQNLFKKKSVHKLTFIELVCVHSHLKKKLQNMPKK